MCQQQTSTDIVTVVTVISEYTELEGDEELPLGEEFQEHMSCFIHPKLKSYREKYRLAAKLVQQLQ